MRIKRALWLKSHFKLDLCLCKHNDEGNEAPQITVDKDNRQPEGHF